jgi:hypothetical protein
MFYYCSGLLTLLFLPEVFQDGVKISSIYEIGIKSKLKIYTPFDGFSLRLLDHFLGGRLGALLTQPNSIFERVQVLPISEKYSNYIARSHHNIIEVPKKAKIDDGMVYSFELKNVPEELSKLAEPSLKIAVIKNPHGLIIPAQSSSVNSRVLFSGMPDKVLKDYKNVKLAISIGATDPRLISYQNIFSEPCNQFLYQLLTFPYGLYGIFNLITLGEPNNNEKNLLKVISEKSPLKEYRHQYLAQFPFNSGYYQPQYGWINTQGFFGSEGFEHRYDQTLNLLGQGILNDESVGFMISGPWWFNQPNNPYAVNLSLKMLEKIGIKPISFFSCDTGGQTGFWYKENNQWKFSHQGNYANMQHTTLAMFGFY